MRVVFYVYKSTTTTMCTYFATTGVNARVIGVLIGNRALLHRNASATVELPPDKNLSNHPGCLFSSAVSSYVFVERRPTFERAPFTSTFWSKAM